MFQIHHVLPQQFFDNPVVRLLTGEFDVRGAANLEALPSDTRIRSTVTVLSITRA